MHFCEEDIRIKYKASIFLTIKDELLNDIASFHFLKKNLNVYHI